MCPENRMVATKQIGDWKKGSVSWNELLWGKKWNKVIKWVNVIKKEKNVTVMLQIS